MLRPHSCVDDPYDHPLPRVPLSACSWPHGTLHVDEGGCIRLLRGYQPVLLDICHVSTLLQEPHLGRCELRSKGIRCECEAAQENAEDGSVWHASSAGMACTIHCTSRRIKCVEGPIKGLHTAADSRPSSLLLCSGPVPNAVVCSSPLNDVLGFESDRLHYLNVLRLELIDIALHLRGTAVHQLLP